MNLTELQELVENQSKAIAILSIRISVLEQILLEKKIISETDVSNKAVELSKDLVEKVQEVIRNNSIKG